METDMDMDMAIFEYAHMCQFFPILIWIWIWKPTLPSTASFLANALKIPKNGLKERLDEHKKGQNTAKQEKPRAHSVTSSIGVHDIASSNREQHAAGSPVHLVQQAKKSDPASSAGSSLHKMQNNDTKASAVLRPTTSGGKKKVDMERESIVSYKHRTGALPPPGVHPAPEHVQLPPPQERPTTTAECIRGKKPPRPQTPAASVGLTSAPQGRPFVETPCSLSEQEVEDKTRELRLKVLMAREQREDTQSQLQDLLLRRDVLLDALGPDLAAEVRNELEHALDAEGVDVRPQLTALQLGARAATAAATTHAGLLQESEERGSSIAQWLETCHQ